MSRYFTPISIKELKKTVNEFKEKHMEDGKFNLYDYNHFTPQITKDLSKVEFDAENVSDDPKDKWGIWKYETMVGYQMLPNGMSFLGIQSGGDWEIPIFYIIYWSGKDLRAYIPQKGNTWNTISNQAVGNDVIKDAKFICKILGKKWDGSIDYELFTSDNSSCIMCDIELLQKDITKRIILKNNQQVD